MQVNIQWVWEKADAAAFSGCGWLLALGLVFAVPEPLQGMAGSLLDIVLSSKSALDLDAEANACSHPNCFARLGKEIKACDPCFILGLAVILEEINTQCCFTFP